jgi:hypothetical protein
LPDNYIVKQVTLYLGHWKRHLLACIRTFKLQVNRSLIFTFVKQMRLCASNKRQIKCSFHRLMEWISPNFIGLKFTCGKRSDLQSCLESRQTNISYNERNVWKRKKKKEKHFLQIILWKTLLSVFLYLFKLPYFFDNTLNSNISITSFWRLLFQISNGFKGFFLNEFFLELALNFWKKNYF